MRPHRLAWLGIADGVLLAVLIRRWASAGEPHRLIDAATVLTLLVGFLGAARAVSRGLNRKPDSQPPAADHSWPPWRTNLAYGSLMIALLWQWAVLGEPFDVLGAVTLSTLMLGFLRAAAATILNDSGTPASTLAPPGHESTNELQDALLLFPAEDAGTNNRMAASHVLATRRKALL